MTENLADKAASSVKKTLGAHSVELARQSPVDATSDELQNEIHRGTQSKKSYEEQIWDAVAAGLNHPAIEGDFFIVVLFKKERHLTNVVHQYFFPRQSCPTPEFDQTVYHYRRKDQKIKYIWTVPDVATCKWLPLKEKELEQDERHLLKMVKDFTSGNLDLLCRRLNNELLLI